MKKLGILLVFIMTTLLAMPVAEAASSEVSLRAMCTGDHRHFRNKFAIKYEVKSTRTMTVKLVAELRDQNGRDWSMRSDDITRTIRPGTRVYDNTIHTDRVPKGSVIRIYGKVLLNGKRLDRDRCGGDPAYF